MNERAYLLMEFPVYLKHKYLTFNRSSLTYFHTLSNQRVNAEHSSSWVEATARLIKCIKESSFPNITKNKKTKINKMKNLTHSTELMWCDWEALNNVVHVCCFFSSEMSFVGLNESYKRWTLNFSVCPDFHFPTWEMIDIAPINYDLTIDIFTL